MDSRLLKARNDFKTYRHKFETVTSEKNNLVIKNAELQSIKFDLTAQVQLKQQERKNKLEALTTVRGKLQTTNESLKKAAKVLKNYEKDMESFKKKYLTSGEDISMDNEAGSLDESIMEYENKISILEQKINENSETLNDMLDPENFFEKWRVWKNEISENA